jgi:hypothetical protein
MTSYIPKHESNPTIFKGVVAVKIPTDFKASALSRLKATVEIGFLAAWTKLKVFRLQHF